ncbi:MAG: cytochrome C oxidase subunit IV family protein [Candidatus Rokubacteria bacterium]|nr:cytochrome C oxidase subunit IV family protein [Candidatus Rokubacteria bacterium]
MAQQTATAYTAPTTPATPARASERAHGHPSYVKIWGILLALLAASIAGPFFGIMWLTLVTAFGIAVVKAVMVAAYFMHLNIEKPLVRYMLLAIAALVLVLWAGIYPDVQKSEGQNWRQAERVVRPAGDAHAKPAGEAGRH